MPKGIKDGTVRIDAAELAALMRQASPSRLAVVCAAQEYRRAQERLSACLARARARGLSTVNQCMDEDAAEGEALDRLSLVATAVALDDE